MKYLVKATLAIFAPLFMPVYFVGLILGLIWLPVKTGWGTAMACTTQEPEKAAQ